MLLTVEKEISENGEVAICFDLEGLEVLIAKLTKLRDHPGHFHLMTASWAGSDLSEDIQGGSRFELCNHLRLVRTI